MLIFIANKFNSLRNQKFLKSYFNFHLKCIYSLRIALGYCRGVIILFTGKIKFSGSYSPLIIGASTELVIRPGSAIVLTDSTDGDASIVINNTSYRDSYKVGIRPHFDFLDPPSHSITRIELLDNAELILEKNAEILPGCYISASRKSKIIIGRNTYVSQEVKINCRTSITIGRNVLIGYQVLVMDYDGHNIISLENFTPHNADKNQIGIVIEDNVWIGAKATILKGVTIGKNSIVGANSCVASDVPPNSIVVGNPAKIVKHGVIWKR